MNFRVPVRAYPIVAAIVCVLHQPGLAQSAERVGPPLFVVERGEARVYIFGGAAPKDRSWLIPTVARAIEESDELRQEDPVEPCSFNRELNIELGARQSGRLFDDLGPAQEARVVAIAERLNFSLDQFQTMRPWAVGAVVAALDYPRHMAEYQPDDAKGVVQKMFLDRGLPVHKARLALGQHPALVSALDAFLLSLKRLDA
jgi:uncharacterized protein YbaP (TraB family)